MKSKLIFSDQNTIRNYFGLIGTLISDRQQTFSSFKTTIRLKLGNRKSLLRIYKKLLKLKIINRVFSYRILSYYFFLKQCFINYCPLILSGIFTFRNIFFFLYHFLVLYRAIFLIKMILDWFPIKNWDRASPIKRFLRRVTIGWTRQFEKYFPSIFAWLIVINIIPTFLYLIERFYITNDFSCFPTSYNFDDMLEFLIESNLNSTPKKITLK